MTDAALDLPQAPPDLPGDRGLSASWSLVPIIGALPLWLAALCDAPAAGTRAVVVGLGLATSRDDAPLGALISPLFSLLPLGSTALRIALASALPAAIASGLLTARAVRRPHAAPRWAASLIVAAFGAMASMILVSARPALSLAAIAIELSFLATSGASRSGVAASLALVPLVGWADPRLLLPVLFATIPARRSLRAIVAGLLSIALLFPLLATLIVREPMTTSLGRWTLTRATTLALPLWTGPIGRLSIVVAALSLLALLLAKRRADRQPALLDDDRAALWVVLGVVGSFALGAGDAVALIGVAFAPIACSACLALHRLTGDSPERAARLDRRVLSLLVPALALGLAARSFEDRLQNKHSSLEHAAASSLAPIESLGLAPANSLIAIDDEQALLAWSGARLSLGLRPDVDLLPLGSLLLGAPAHLAGRTTEAEPAARPLLRALLATGTLDEADAAPLCQLRPLLSSIDPARARGLARHARATPGGLRFALERVDPSDRRLAGALLERRMMIVAQALDDDADALRPTLRHAARSEAWLLSLAGDRTAAIAALGRSVRFGASANVAARWSMRINARGAILERADELD